MLSNIWQRCRSTIDKYLQIDSNVVCVKLPRPISHRFVPVLKDFFWRGEKKASKLSKRIHFFIFSSWESSHLLKKLTFHLSKGFSISTLSFLSLCSLNRIHLWKISFRLSFTAKKESIIFTFLLRICAAERLFWSAQNLLFVLGNFAPSSGHEASFLVPNSLK